MKKLVFLVVFGVIVLSSRQAMAEVSQEKTYYLPQVVDGDHWRSVLVISSNSPGIGEVRVEFFDDQGIPLVLDTDHGINHTFVFSIASDTAEVIVTSRQHGQRSGWVRVKSVPSIDVFLTFEQYEGGKLVGYGTVSSSPTRLAFSVLLDSSFGIALANPFPDDAKIIFWVKQGQIDLTPQQHSFVLKGGHHLARFFFEEPFNLKDVRGKIIISSNIELSAVALQFKGPAFSTLPLGEAPRRIDLPKRVSEFGEQIPGEKIGVVCFEPSDRVCPKELVAQAANEVFTVWQELLDREMPLNGFRSKPLPIDRDELGQPKVVEVRGRKVAKDYLLPPEKQSQDWINGTIDGDAITRELRSQDFTDYSVVLAFVDTFFLNPSGPPTGFIAQAGGFTPYFTGIAYVSSFLLPFLKQGLLERTDSFFGIVVPEFDNQRLWTPEPGHGTIFGNTFGQLADESFALLIHELTHGAIVPWHSDLERPYLSVMGTSQTTGIFRKNGTTQAVLTVQDAALLSVAPAFNPEYFHWTELDISAPSIPKIVAKEYSNEKQQFRVVVSTGDEESGIRFLAVAQNWFSLLYFREVTLADRGDLEVVISISLDSLKEGGLHIYGINHQGFFNGVALTP